MHIRGLLREATRTRGYPPAAINVAPNTPLAHPLAASGSSRGCISAGLHETAARTPRLAVRPMYDRGEFAHGPGITGEAWI